MKWGKTITLDVYRKHTTGMEYFEPMTFAISEVVAFERGSFDWLGERLTKITIKNKSYKNPTDLEVLMPYHEAKDIFGETFEKVKIC